MDTWEIFLQRGKKDVLLSQKLFQENHDYEMSAYVAQQALEKFVKAYLLKSKIVANPRDLGHYQIPRIISTISTQFNIMKRNTDKSNPLYLMLEHMSNIIDHSRKLFESIRDGDEKLVHWWKKSLEISQDVKDEDYERFVELMSRTGDRLGKSLTTYFANRLNPNTEKFAQISKELPKEIQMVSEYMEEAVKQLKNKSIVPVDEIKSKSNAEIAALLKIINLQKQGKIKGNLPIYELEKSVVMFDILANYVDLLMETYPHEIIGRYPQMNDGLTTEEYEKHKDELWNLIINVKHSCDEIEMKINS